MKDQHTLVKGYRDLSQEEIDLMNRIKEEGENIADLIKMLELMPECDPRWVSIGRTDLQKGIMSLVRAVAKPSSF
jgi:hypothetical protein